jgi:hypothetical protein
MNEEDIIRLIREIVHRFCERNENRLRCSRLIHWLNDILDGISITRRGDDVDVDIPDITGSKRQAANLFDLVSDALGDSIAAGPYSFGQSNPTGTDTSTEPASSAHEFVASFLMAVAVLANV